MNAIQETLDLDVECLIIGAGPAGLTAATYLGRFKRRICVIDGGASRASWIPISHNLIGFTEGISGEALLVRMRSQAANYGAKIIAGQVQRLTLLPNERFMAFLSDRFIQADRVLIATGGLDVEPAVPEIRDAVKDGLVRYCPICDAFEATGRKVGLIAYGKCRLKEALLLRTYTDHLTVLTLGREMNISDAERQIMESAGIAVIDDPVTRLTRDADSIRTWHKGERMQAFDIIYSALGTEFRTTLATQLGAEADEDGALIVDRHQKTRVLGLYAAGDAVRGLSQINVAASQAAIAATDINASLPPLHFER